MAALELPRAVAAAAVVHGLANAQRILIVAGLLFGAVTLAELMVARGRSDAAPLVAAPVAAVALLGLVMMWRPMVLTAVLFLAGGAVSSVAVVALALEADPSIVDSGPFAINRTATALVLVGALQGSAVSGMVWSAAGVVVAYGSLSLGLTLTSTSTPLGWGPLIVFSVSFLGYSTLSIAQRRAATAAPDLQQALGSLERSERQRALELRAAAIVHDTVLADLTVVAASTGPLDERARQRFQADLDLVRSATVRHAVVMAPAPTPFASQLLELAHDFQWSGVRVDVSGAELIPDTVCDEVADALLAASRAALDNVARHSGADHADLVVGVRDDLVSVLIVDDGHGFDPGAVPADRLGLRTAIRARVDTVGGSVRIWSGDDGTTVMLTAPVAGGTR